MENEAVRIIAVDDEQSVLNLLEDAFCLPRYQTTTADRGSRALELLGKKEFDVLVLDLDMPEMNGVEVLEKVKGMEVPVEVVILTGFATVSSAVDAMKLGAYDYLTKPIKLDELESVIKRAAEKKQLVSENVLLKTQVQRQSEVGKIVHRSKAMEEVLDTVNKVAASDFPVLITGETGVGKELIAKAIHRNSPRLSGPFIALNCGSISEAILESELFGHEKGSFTGAHAKKPGLLEVANGGTLFLDEIGEMALSLQSKLLRVLETGSFYRVGGIREISVNVRFVSATNRDIEKEAEEGKFRSDLYYRIAPLPLHIPPLRERIDDIPPLVEHFLGNPAFRGRGFAPAAIDVLLSYRWPGNVRELQNVIHRVLLLSENEVIGPEDLTFCFPAEQKGSPRRLDDVERELILKVLKDTGGHRGKAAEILGINPKTLYRKLKEYGVTEGA